MEIAEDEEGYNKQKSKRTSTVPEELPVAVKDPSTAAFEPTAPQDLTSPPPPRPQPAHSTSQRSVVSEAAAHELGPRRPSLAESRSKSPTRSLFRRSFQSGRPDLETLESSTSSWKPKIKLGPRPSLDRPHTSESSTNYRPVSTLPKGLRLFSRGSKKSKSRPQSQYLAPAPDMDPSASNISHIDDSQLTISTPSRPHTSGGRPTTSSGATNRHLKSPAVDARTPTITPEKARLMKAMQLRKKQMDAHVSGESMPAPGTPNAAAETLQVLNGVTTEEHMGVAETEAAEAHNNLGVTGADSIPSTPIGHSEKAESTPATSISDSTDETAHGKITAAETSTDPVLKKSENAIVGGSQSTAHADKLEAAAVTQEQEDVLKEAVQHPLPGDASMSTLSSKADANAQIDQAEIAEDVETRSLSAGPEISLSTAVEPQPQVATLAPSPIPREPELRKPNEEVVSEEAHIQIPTSKLSMRDLQGAETEVTSLEVSMPALHLPPKSPVESNFSLDGKHGDEHEGQIAGHTTKKRRAAMQPVRTDGAVSDVSAMNSDDDLFSDDDLMDELHSATVQEAQPISVSKSPIVPYFATSPNRKGSPNKNRSSRIFSSPTRSSGTKNQSLAPPEKPQEITRSVSASSTYLERISQQQAEPLAKKPNIGSSISQRIKALERVSSSAGNAALPATTAGTLSNASPTFFSVRKANSVRGPPSRSASIADRTSSLTRNTPSPTLSRDSSPETVKARSRTPSGLSRREEYLPSSIYAPQLYGRPETVSVTARIIRDPSQPFPQLPEVGKNPTDYPALNLKESPLIIDHQKAVPPSPKKDMSYEPRPPVAEGRRSKGSDRPSSRRDSNATSPVTTRPLSMSSRQSSKDFITTTTTPPTPTSNGAGIGDDRSDKKSRATRMLHRMSSSLAASRKTLSHAMSPTPREESNPVDLPASFTPLSPAARPPVSAGGSVDIGDVNVQFPDNLLWKRRCLRLDAQGFLLLSQSKSDEGSKAGAGIIKKYYMGDFTAPFAPDIDRQEMPNSVVLDFIEGGGLQIACEDRAGQIHVLNGEWSKCLWRSKLY